MSRIGKKPIAVPSGVKVNIQGNLVSVQGPKGKLDTPVPTGIKVEQKDGHLVAIRENDSQAAVHGLARALVFNAVEGVTNGWKKELEIVGIGYRVEMKGKGTVVFTLGFSHPIEFPLPAGIDVAVDPKQTRLTVSRVCFGSTATSIPAGSGNSMGWENPSVNTTVPLPFISTR